MFLEFLETIFALFFEVFKFAASFYTFFWNFELSGNFNSLYDVPKRDRGSPLTINFCFNVWGFQGLSSSQKFLRPVICLLTFQQFWSQPQKIILNLSLDLISTCPQIKNFETSQVASNF